MTTTAASAAGGAVSGTVGISPPWTTRRVLLLTVSAGFLALSLWGLRKVELSIVALVEGWPETLDLLRRMSPPFLPREDWGTITQAVVDTFFMAFAGTAIGVFLALPLAIAAARTTMPYRPVRVVARAIIVFTRAVPALVFALVFVRVYGIGVLPGILAIGVHAVGMIGKLLTDAAENIEPGAREGVTATGAGPFQELVTGVWSQMVPTAIAVSLYRLEIDFRGATLLGFVGAGGIGLILRAYQGNLRYQELLATTLLIIILVIAMEVASSFTRRIVLGGNASGSATTVGSLRRPWTADRVKLTAASVGAVALLIASFAVPDISFATMLTKTMELPDIAWRLVPKNLDWLSAAVRADLVETIAIGFASTFLALVVSIPAAFLAASNTAPGALVHSGVRLFVLLVRAAPELVLAVLFVAAIGLGPAAGTLALALGIFGFGTKLFADAIEEVAAGPRDGVAATGATRLQQIVTAVMPQAMPSLLGNGLYLLDVSLRSSTVLGIVGAGGIGFLLSQASRTLKFEVMGGIVLAIFLLVYAIELLASWLRRQMI